MKNNNKGFSLVELIVVIAIMAILAAVAVVSFSLYIPKAQKANDKQLVNDILYAVELRDMETQFAADQNGVIGYVILTNDGDAYATAGEVDEAMKAVFGNNYKAELRLSYDGWTDTILMLQEVSDESIKQYIGSVNESTYISDVGTDKLLSDVQHCATSFGEFLGASSDGDFAEATQTLIGGFSDSTVVTELLSKAGYTEENYDEVTPEVLQNVTVFAVASAVKQDKEAVVDKFEDQGFLGNSVTEANSLDEVAAWYAAAEALVAYLNDKECTDAFNAIDMTSNNAAAIGVSMMAAHSAIQDELSKEGNEKLLEKYNNYYEVGADGKSQATKDGEAYVAIMSSVNNIGGEYLTDESSVQSSNLFDGGVMNNRVNSYIAAANLADQIQTDEQLKNLLTDKESAVVVIVCSNNGMLECLPLPAGVVD